jgi:hypothetical protein
VKSFGVGSEAIFGYAHGPDARIAIFTSRCLYVYNGRRVAYFTTEFNRRLTKYRESFVYTPQ